MIEMLSILQATSENLGSSNTWVALVSALGAIITTCLATWTKYNQSRHDKITDVKISQFQDDQKKKYKVRSTNVATIYGQLWFILHELKADRVFIIQPHPLVRTLYLVTTMEVSRQGLVTIKSTVPYQEISQVANFSSILAKRDYVQWLDVSEIQDKKAKSIMALHGTISCVIKRLSDNEHDWIGSLFVDFQKKIEVDLAELKKVVTESADMIQCILPPVEDDFNPSNL